MKGDAHRAWYGRRALSFREGQIVSTNVPEERVSVSTFEQCCRILCASDLPEGQPYAWTSVAASCLSVSPCHAERTPSEICVCFVRSALAGIAFFWGWASAWGRRHSRCSSRAGDKRIHLPAI